MIDETSKWSGRNRSKSRINNSLCRFINYCEPSRMEGKTTRVDNEYKLNTIIAQFRYCQVENILTFNKSLK